MMMLFSALVTTVGWGGGDGIAFLFSLFFTAGSNLSMIIYIERSQDRRRD